MLMQEEEQRDSVEVAEAKVACDGGGVLGHPKVYLEIGAEGFVDCPYCGCRYVLKAGGH